MNKNQDQTSIADTILELLRSDLSRQPVLARIVTKLMSDFIKRLYRFTGDGFEPGSVAELEIVLDELFGETLHLLVATSIHSNHKELISYKGYWEHRDLGPFFRKKNREFLQRTAGQKMKRVYACDSLADCVAEPWFGETAVEHVHAGAEVKIVQIDGRRPATYEDFGVYAHQVGAIPAGKYLLRAPKQEGDSEELKTVVISNDRTVTEYETKFERLWGQSDRILKFCVTERFDEPADWLSLHHGTGAINALFEKKVILRKLQRLDTGEKLMDDNSGFVRKYETSYARAVSEHIQRRFSNTKFIFYVGDTYKNDGAAIRNLQALGWDVTGFICEPKLKMERLWFNSTLYTNHWTDLIDFAHEIDEKEPRKCLAIFDIDQTLWAPKGIAEGPLNRTRTEAILKLVDEYLDRSTGEAAEVTAKIAKDRIPDLYREISEIKYQNHLTLDNEDYKAAICVFLALNIFWSDELDTDGDFFKQKAAMNKAQFMKYVTTEYLPNLIQPGKEGESNMTHFILTTMGAANTDQFNVFGVASGLNPSRLRREIVDIHAQIVGPATVKFRAFRNLELQEALSLAGGSGDPGTRLVLNKPVWDMAEWFKKRNIPLLALSDRPEEATFIPDGESLLNVEMTICGPAIGHLLGDHQSQKLAKSAPAPHL